MIRMMWLGGHWSITDRPTLFSKVGWNIQWPYRAESVTLGDSHAKKGPHFGELKLNFHGSLLPNRQSLMAPTPAVQPEPARVRIYFGIIFKATIDVTQSHIAGSGEGSRRVSG